MSAANDGCQICACPDPVITAIPGVEGEQGAAGTNGTNGVNAYTLTTASFVVPVTGNTVSIAVANSSWMTVGQNIFVQGAGYFSVSSKSSSLQVTALYLIDYPANTNSGSTISSGAQISPSGEKPDFAVPLPSGITDGSTGTASSFISAGVGIQTFQFYIDAATIANGDLLTNYVFGFAFKIEKVDVICAKPVTTGAKGSTLNLEINTTNLTGGVVTLAGTYALGAQVNGTVVAANNTGTSSDTFSIEASGTTAFVEGAFLVVISVRNLDTTNAVASLAGKVNDLIASLA